MKPISAHSAIFSRWPSLGWQGHDVRLIEDESEARPDPWPDRLLRRRHQCEDVTVIRHLIQGRRVGCLASGNIGLDGPPNDRRGVRIVIHFHDHILDWSNMTNAPAPKALAGGDVVSVSGVSSGCVVVPSVTLLDSGPSGQVARINSVRVVMPPTKKAAPTAKKAAASAKTAQAKAAAQATVTLNHLAADLADGHDIAKKQPPSMRRLISPGAGIRRQSQDSRSTMSEIIWWSVRSSADGSSQFCNLSRIDPDRAWQGWSTFAVDLDQGVYLLDAR
jgi:hypothetical protein